MAYTMQERTRDIALNRLPVEQIPIPFHDQLRDQEQQLKNLKHTTKEALHIARKSGRLNLNEILEVKDELRKANEKYRNYEQAKTKGTTALWQNIERHRAEHAFESTSEKIISYGAENRAVWLDRKDIVGSGPDGLSKKILSLKKAGITTLYIECDNGGYALYDSKLLKRNPDLEQWPGWDPLREALNTAHAQNLKVEAWTKVFAVCNRALDEQFQSKYPDRKFPPAGPVLEEHDKATAEDPYGDWALRMYDGTLPERTHDVFLDPANPKAAKFAQNFMLEIAERYPDIDGIQYDYIRYPFRNEGMGLNPNNWAQFQSANPQYKGTELPGHPSQMKGAMLKDWNEWKNQQIDNFVGDTSARMRQLNPKLDLSAAVYPCDLNDPLRQQWSRWLKNGSVDTLNPMTYVPHDASSRDAEFTQAFERKFRSDINEISHELDDKTTLLPGIMVSRVNPRGMMRQIEIVRELKLPGETLFATSVLDQSRLRVLELDNASRAFQDFEKLSRIALRSSAAQPEMADSLRDFRHDVHLLGKSLKSPLDEAGSRQNTVERLEAIRDQLNKMLNQKPALKNAWTKHLADLLQTCLHSL